MVKTDDKEKQAIIKNFFDSDGKLKNIPAQRKKKLIVLEHIVQGLKIGQLYSEAEINEFIKNSHADYATIRREFIISHFMSRQNGQYQLNPKEMWLI